MNTNTKENRDARLEPPAHDHDMDKEIFVGLKAAPGEWKKQENGEPKDDEGEREPRRVAPLNDIFTHISFEIVVPLSRFSKSKRTFRIRRGTTESIGSQGSSAKPSIRDQGQL
jgi:hypothetical protein